MKISAHFLKLALIPAAVLITACVQQSKPQPSTLEPPRPEDPAWVEPASVPAVAAGVDGVNEPGLQRGRWNPPRLRTPENVPHPFDQVGQIGIFETPWPSYQRQYRALCSGLAISPTQVMTASHCVNDPFLPENPELVFVRGRNGANLDPTAVHAVLKIHHLNEVAWGAEHDIALLQVELIPAAKTLPLEAKPVQPGRPVLLVGYPVPLSPLDGENTGTSWIARGHEVARDPKAPRSVLATDQCAMKGDSGSALFAYNFDRAAWELHGIVNRVDAGRECETRESVSVGVARTWGRLLDPELIQWIQSLTW